MSERGLRPPRVDGRRARRERLEQRGALEADDDVRVDDVPANVAVGVENAYAWQGRELGEMRALVLGRLRMSLDEKLDLTSARQLDERLLRFRPQLPPRSEPGPVDHRQVRVDVVREEEDGQPPLSGRAPLPAARVDVEARLPSHFDDARVDAAVDPEPTVMLARDEHVIGDERGDLAPLPRRCVHPRWRDRRLLLQDHERDSEPLHGFDRRTDPEEGVRRSEDGVEPVDAVEALDLLLRGYRVGGARLLVLRPEVRLDACEYLFGEVPKCELVEDLVADRPAARAGWRDPVERLDVLLEVVIDAEEPHSLAACLNSSASSPMISWSCARPSRKIASRSSPSVLKPIRS